METLYTVLLVILGLVLMIGTIRVIIRPYNGFGNFMLEWMLLDLMGDLISAIIESLGDSDNHTDW